MVVKTVIRVCCFLVTDCGSLLSPGNGSVTVTVTTFTSTAVYTCYMGHYISAGTQERTCLHGGSWNGTQPTCTIYSKNVTINKLRYEIRLLGKIFQIF